MIPEVTHETIFEKIVTKKMGSSGARMPVLPIGCRCAGRLGPNSGLSAALFSREGHCQTSTRTC